MDHSRAGASPIGAPVWVFWATARDHVDLVDLVSVLSPGEVARAERYRSARARAEFVTGARLVRAVAGVMTGSGESAGHGRAGRDAAVDRTCPDCGEQHGPPRLPARPDVHLSVTHAGGVVGLAVSVGARVGLDLEPRATAPDPALIATVCSAAERRALAALEAAPRAAEFTRLWCRKEAVVKAVGVGLAVPVASIDVTGSHPLVAEELHPPERWVDPRAGSWVPVAGPGRGFASSLFSLDPARLVAEVVVADPDRPFHGASATAFATATLGSRCAQPCETWPPGPG